MTSETETETMASCQEQEDLVDDISVSSVLYRQLRQPNTRIIGSKGCYLYTEDKGQIIDASSGAAVSCIGHNDPRVQRSIMEQLEKVEYCYSYYFTTPAAEELSKILTDSTGGEMSKVYIVGSGMCDARSNREVMVLPLRNDANQK